MEFETVVGCVRRLASTFEDDELAFLSLTSKNEFVIRDRVAFQIHRMNPHLVVAREYRHIDLAILEQETLVDVLEFKSWYTFDFLEQPKGVSAATKKDFQKNDRVPGANKANKYAIITATHVGGTSISPRLSGVVKYTAGINKLLSRRIPMESVMDSCEEVLRQNFEDRLYRRQRILMDAGNAFGCRVHVGIWILKQAT